MSLQSVASIALSGMSAARVRMDAAAHNVANLGTADFRREQVITQPQVGGGVEVSLAQATQPGENLAQDVVDQRMALYGFKANLRVFQAEQDMLGSLLDIQA